jgi:hypothetical protein
MFKRLRAPSGWSRSARLAATVGVPLAVVSLVAAIAIGRLRRTSRQEAPIAATAALADIRPTAPATAETAASPPAAPPVQPPPVEAPSVEAPPVHATTAKGAASAERPAPPAAPVVKAAKAPPPASTEGAFSPKLQKRHLGRLTVHSVAPYAKVYMMNNRLGRVDETLTVVCGQRFIAIGVPPRGGRTEPVWLAPGKSVNIPCGGSLTMTMNPRRVR